MKDIKLIDMMNAIDSSSSTPGGGSVSALAGELGIALGRMYGHLSIKNKKFNEQEKAVIDEFNELFEQLADLRIKMNQQIEEDINAYDHVIAAYRSKDEKQIDASLEVATKVPLKVMELSIAAMECCIKMLPFGNLRAVSDGMIAIILCHACLEASSLNVKINLSSRPDKEVEEKMNHLLMHGSELKKRADKIYFDLMK